MLNITEYEEYLLNLIRGAGFIAGREIVEKLATRFKLSPEYGRKILQRANEKGLIKSSKPVTFGKGQFIYTLSSKEVTIADLKPICAKYRPPLYRVLEALDANEGVLSYYEALKIVSSPLTESRSKTDSLDDLIEALVDLKLIQVKEDHHEVRYLIDAIIEEPAIGLAMEAHYSKMVMDCVFIPDFIKFLRQINVIDNLKTVYRNKFTPSRGAPHNNLVWDAFAYTKTTGINPVVGKKADSIETQTLVVLDIVINREYEQFDLDGFLARVQIHQNSVKGEKRKVMPIVFYSEVSDKVFNTIRALGFMAFNITAIFGSKIKDIIQHVSVVQKKIFTNQSIDSLQDITQSIRAIRDSGQEENLSNLKGILFEYLLYPLIKHLYPNAAILQNQSFKEKKEDATVEKYEYDYIVQSTSPKEIVVIELKGYSSQAKIPVGSMTQQNSLTWFFGRNLPFVKKKYAKELGEGYILRACYITSAGFWDDGLKYLNNLAAFKSKKLEQYYDGRGLLDLLDENEMKHIKSAVEKYYITKEEDAKKPKLQVVEFHDQFIVRENQIPGPFTN